MSKPFRKDFLWGFATAAAQIEGGGADIEKKSGRGPSIWDTFCDTKGKIVDGTHVNMTCNHYEKFKEDVALIPNGGKDDPVNEQGLQFYDDLIDELLAARITPFVTLYHWDLPQALQDRYGGWLSKDAIPDFVRYAQLCFGRYGDRVKHWLTFNEPWCVSVLGNGIGQFAPGHKSNTEPWIVGHNIILSHAHATKLYREQFRPQQGGQIGITLNGDWAEPFDSSPENVQASEDRLSGTIGWFADPIYLGSYPPVLVKMLGDRLPKFTDEEIKLVKGSSDFYGMNTYTSNMIKAGGTDEFNTMTQVGFEKPDGSLIGTQSSLDWLRDVPWGLRKLLNYIHDRYKMPIFMTENGYAIKGESSLSKEVAIHDNDRVKFYTGYLQSLKEAVAEDGVDVRSYFGWSLMDNFEWNSGLVPRFGCVYTDFETFERTPKDSAASLAKFFKDNVPA